MLVWNGKSLEQMDTEFFGVILFGGLLCVLFPETLLDSIGIKKESKVMVILCRVFGSMAFLLGFHEMFFISTFNRYGNMILTLVVVSGAIFFRYLVRNYFK